MDPATRAAFERQIQGYREEYLGWIASAREYEAENPGDYHAMDTYMKAQDALDIAQRMERIVDAVDPNFTRRSPPRIPELEIKHG
jgi:hypothetical protein